MTLLKRYLLFFVLITLAIYSSAQNITGTWEGDLSNDQFIQLIIIQNGDKICGYTRDHVKDDTSSYCKAFFEGIFDKKKERLSIKGKFFIENSGSHVLMKINLNYRKAKGVEILEQKPTPVNAFSSLISILKSFNDDPFAETSEIEMNDYVYLKKVSDVPLEVIDLMRDCIDNKSIDTVLFKPKDSVPPAVKIIQPEQTKDSVPANIKVIIPEKRLDSLPVDMKVVTIANPKDSAEVSVPKVTITERDSILIPKEVKKRKNIEQSHLEINVKTINLKVYDNAIVDGDTVSILYNGRLLFSHQRLTEKGLEINLNLDLTTTRHEITLFAENLGSIPPNTALVVITAGKKRYELFASASLEENAVLVFDYIPDK